MSIGAARRAAATAAVWALGGLFAGYVGWYLSGWGDHQVRTAVSDAVYTPFCLAFTTFAVLLARDPRGTARTRRAWWIITTAFGCQTIAHVTWFFEDAVLHRGVYPAIADYWFLAFTPIMAAGLLMLPQQRLHRRGRIKLALDALIVGTSTCMVLWYWILGPMVVGPQSVITIGYSAASPVADLLMVFALATVLLRGGVSRPVLLLTGAVATTVVADFYYNYVQQHAVFVGGNWADLFWLSGSLLFVLGTFAQWRRPTEGRASVSSTAVVVAWLPYAAIALACGLLIVLAGGHPLYPDGGVIFGAVILTSLVVARQMYALRENRRLAVSDPLTGLANRTLLTECLDQLVSQPLREGQYAAVLLVDLDHFKPINDSYGHEAGDAVLKAVATVLTSVLRAKDVAGRLGGDEFAVVLTDLPSPEAATRIAERIVAALDTPVIHGDQLLTVQASLGVAVRTSPETSGDTLLQNADTAMYTAKRQGRGRVAVYSPLMDPASRDAELRAAIAGDQLVAHYQPIIDLGTGATIGVEALVRWQHPERGLIMPGDFIDLAEETGAIVPLGEWILRAACRQVAQWRATLPGAAQLRLSVNLSPKQVARPELVRVVTAILAETGFPGDQLVLELTETSILRPDPATIARLDDLCRLGIQLAVDDFGTGYSALSYLRELPVSILKLDRSFISGIATDPDERAVADALIRLGAAYKLSVLAEGIETEAQAAVLRELGCGFAQGYHFGRPAAAADLTSTLTLVRPRS